MNVHNSFTNKYHPQTNGQVERYNRSILAALPRYVTDHPRDWDVYKNELNYEYNWLPHTTTSMEPFDLVLSKAPGPIYIEPMPIETLKQCIYKARWICWLQDKLSKTKKRIDAA